MRGALYLLDALVPILATVGWHIAYCRGRLERWLYLSYGWGVLVGCLWEIPIGLLGHDFNQMLERNPLGFWIHLNHALVDSFLLLAGLWCVGATRRDELVEAKSATRTLRTLTAFTCLELVQAVTVELVFNGQLWKYSTTVRWNPVLFWIHGVGYTLWPFLVWALAPTLFYTGARRIAVLQPPRAEWGHLESIEGDAEERDSEDLEREPDRTTFYRREMSADVGRIAKSFGS